MALEGGGQRSSQVGAIFFDGEGDFSGRGARRRLVVAQRDVDRVSLKLFEFDELQRRDVRAQHDRRRHARFERFLLAVACDDAGELVIIDNYTTERLVSLTIHHGRHTYISHALAGGPNLAEVRDAAAHSNVTMTSGYLHVTIEDDGLAALFGLSSTFSSPALDKYRGCAPLRTTCSERVPSELSPYFPFDFLFFGIRFALHP